ncbi:MAG TPA: outer membrane protein assembly factor BamA, partial [Candidatus Binataceae bacterium]|nr:outer membrane protein assembly factor BamA [Candidatus Binataceae bacterium]
LWLPIGAVVARAQSNPIINDIQVEGNQRVEVDAIRLHISQRTGEPLNRDAVSNDIKSIYQMGFFRSVTAETRYQGGRDILVYHVAERPQITDVKINGMKAIRPTDDAIVAAMKLHPGSILDPARVNETKKGIRDAYQGKGYADARVEYREVLGPNNTEVGNFDVTEGARVYIREIDFTGNHAFSARELRGQMDTATHIPVVSSITSIGVLDRKKLDEDTSRIAAFYYDHGYLNVHVGEPDITRAPKGLKIVIPIDEGPIFTIGAVDLSGDLKYPRSELVPLITIKPGSQFRGSAMQHDVLTLSDFYSDRGYAFVNVDTKTSLDAIARKVNITFVINPGREVLVNRVNITGNTKTSDKVIRREMQVQEQEPYSASAIRDSKRRLDQLGFFSATRITTEPSAQPDKVDLNVNVTEQSTASFQLAGGFDTYQSVFGHFQLGNTNLFGGGEAVLLSAQVGFLFQNYTASYTEPWFLDIPLSVSLSVFDSKTDLFTFHQNSAGGAINSSYPLVELGLKQIGPLSLKDVRAGLGYQFESVGIGGLSPFTTFQIARFRGYTKVSELLPSIRRATVDNPIDPRSGSIESLNLELAGIGPGTAFIKGLAHWRFYYTFLKSPTFGQWVFSPGATYGIGTTLSNGSGGELPLYERFFPGGVGGQGDVRGYQLYSLGPNELLLNQSGIPLQIENFGGSKELLLDGEITFPILSGLGIRGVIFADAGQAYRLSDSVTIDSLQAAYGIGIRWRSPFGPIALDVARPINPRPQDMNNVFEFGGGAPL